MISERFLGRLGDNDEKFVRGCLYVYDRRKVRDAYDWREVRGW